MIIKSPSIFYSSTFIVYPCPAGVIDFQSYNCINYKVPKKEKIVNCDAKTTEEGCINLSFIILSWTLLCPWVWWHLLTKNILELCFPVSNVRGYWGLFSVSFRHLHFEACILGGEPSAPEFTQSFPAEWNGSKFFAGNQEHWALLWGCHWLVKWLPLWELRCCNFSSEHFVTRIFLFPSSSLKIKISQRCH